jgi:drug/metabolite transporter (DMT)-like permease
MSRHNISSDSVGANASDRGTLIAFVLLVLFAGGNAVAIRVSNIGLPPLWGAAIRAGGAALVFWVIVALRRLALPRGRALLGAMLYGLLIVGVGYAMLYWGLQRLPAGLGSTLLALVPLTTLFLAWVHGLEELRWRAVAGALIAVAGVLYGLAGGLSGAVHVPSVLGIVVATACLAEASVVLKLFPRSHPLVVNAVAFTTGAPIPLLASWLAGERWSLPNTVTTWAALAYLVLLGSVVVFYLYLHVLSRWTASATSYSFLLIPVATVIVAALVLGEAITVPFLVGAALVLAGVWVGAIQRPPKEVELTCPGLPTRAVC